MIKNVKYIYIIYLLILIVIIIFLVINYYNGITFHACNNENCKENQVFYINVKPLPNNLVNMLENSIRKNGSELNPKYNNNNVKGKKMNYYQLPEEIRNFYIDDNLRKSVSYMVNENVYYANETERYRIFARLYENESDFLNWHYDNNFTKGNRYTLVIPILVDSGNTSEFMIKDSITKEEKIIPIPLGTGVIYNGSITYHTISKQTDGQRRLVIIIPFYTNYNKSFVGNIRQIIRNITDDTLTI